MQNGQSPENPILLTAVNDPYKSDYDRFMVSMFPAFDARYNTIAGTSGTLKIVEKYLPHKRLIDLGHGPDFGDIWAITFMLEQLAAGRRLEALILIHPSSGQLHRDFILVLMLSLLKANVVWWPTLASAAAFFNAIAPGVGRDLLTISGSVSL